MAKTETAEAVGEGDAIFEGGVVGALHGCTVGEGGETTGLEGHDLAVRRYSAGNLDGWHGNVLLSVRKGAGSQWSGSGWGDPPRRAQPGAGD